MNSWRGAAGFGGGPGFVHLRSTRAIRRRNSASCSCMSSNSFAFSLPNIAGYIQKMIRSAIVPVAGLGTRLLPATKSQPKEMLPVAKKPIVQYVVEELASAGIEQVLFVTGRGKTSIENHFDHDPELCRSLTNSEKNDLLHELGFEQLKVHYFYTRQRLQRGLGDAILCGENFAGEESFLVALGDSIIGLNGHSTISRR